MPLPIGGALSKAGTPVSRAFQVETGTVLGTIGAAGAGNATVIVTAVGMTGTPKTVSVAVANNDTATIVAGKIRTDLAANADVNAFFIVSGAGADVVLTARTYAANDATMNINIANGTCTGLTNAPTSTNTTAGSVGDWKGCENGTYCLDTTNAVIYQNTGTTQAAAWTAI